MLLWLPLVATRRPVTVSLEPFDAKLRLRPRLRSGSTWPFLFRAHYDPELFALRRLLKPGDVFVDGGANIGIYTVVAAVLVGSRGTVFAFEPTGETFEQLRDNVRLNNAAHVHVIRAALSDTDGRQPLFHVANAPNLYSLGRHAGEPSDSESVPVRTLDSFDALWCLHRLDVIKLDIEGAEELALRGAHELITTHWPHIIFEVQPGMPERLSLSTHGACDLLRELGYSIAAISEDERNADICDHAAGNFLAVPPIKAGS